VGNFPQFEFLDLCVVYAGGLLFFLSFFGLFKLFFKDNKICVFILYCFGVFFWLSHPVAVFFRDHFEFSSWLCHYKWSLLLVACIIGFLICIFFAKKCKNIVSGVNSVVSVFIYLLTGILLINLLIQFSTSYQRVEENTHNYSKKLPNVYHILLDAHPNLNGMKNLGGDLELFYHELEKLGFLVYPNSHSNYCGTSYSVLSMTSMNYIDGDELKYLPFYYYNNIKNSDVFKTLSSQYNLYFLTHVSFVKPFYPKCKDCSSGLFMFLYTLLAHTPIKHQFEKSFSNVFRENILNGICKTINCIERGKEIYGVSNCYFYTHILCPHEPFVFGNLISRFSGFWNTEAIDLHASNGYLETARAQVKGIDNLILPCLKNIIQSYNENEMKPIIILHSDHGLYSKNVDHTEESIDNAYGNLLAIYIPEEWHEDANRLEFINLYRFIFNHLLGKDYKYLKHKQIYRGKEL